MDLRDGWILDVDVDQGEVLAGVAVHQFYELRVTAIARKLNLNIKILWKLRG